MVKFFHEWGFVLWRERGKKRVKTVREKEEPHSPKIIGAKNIDALLSADWTRVPKVAPFSSLGG